MEAQRQARARPEVRREEILAAAREVLAEHGYERTTVSQIAARAQVAQGTFYLYFPSKEALPGELAVVLSRAMGEATRRVTSAPSLDDGVEALVEAVFASAREARDLLPMANRGVELAEDFEEWARLTAPWREALEAFLERFRATGEIGPEIEVATTAYVLRDLLDRAAKAQVLFGRPDYASATTALVRRALGC